MTDAIALPNPRADAALAFLARGQRGTSGRPYTSDLSVDEAIVLKELGYNPLGLVVGSSVYHIGFPMTTSLWNTNCEVQQLTAAMYQAREKAIGEMVQMGRSLGAEGVVGVNLTINMYSAAKHTAEFFAMGTAVSRPPGHPQSGNFFTSDLSGQQLFLLEKAGYTPVALVMGACVYNVAHQGISKWLGQQTQNVELTNFTTALYEARELAMLRMQGEAKKASASGIVGVTISEKSHVWGSHVIEFFAMGTGVKLMAEKYQQLGVTMVVGLEEPEQGFVEGATPVAAAGAEGQAAAANVTQG